MGHFYFEGGKDAVDYGILFPDDMPQPELKSINFSRVNLETGTRVEYLPPLDMANFTPYIEEGFQHYPYNAVMIPFYNEGKWDGVTFIYCLPLDHLDRYMDSREKRVCYALSFIENHWKVDKIAEFSFPYEGNDSPYPSFLFWKDHLVTTLGHLGRDLFIKRSPLTGKFFTEPFPSPYRAIYNRAASLKSHFRIENSNFSAPPVDLIDREGKVHFLVYEGGDFTANIYHEVYNPNAPDPTVPELREFIEHQE